MGVFFRFGSDLVGMVEGNLVFTNAEENCSSLLFDDIFGYSRGVGVEDMPTPRSWFPMKERLFSPSIVRTG